MFEESFKKLFPNYHLIFTNSIKISDLHNIDCIFFGGGSFLNEKPLISEEALVEIKKLKIFYIGIGPETEIHPIHLELMKISKLIAVRSSTNLEKINQINDNVIVIPDLVYNLNPSFSNVKLNKSVLIIPNISVIPKWNEPNWKHVAWNYFKSEFGQFLDGLVVNNFIINFLPLCENCQLNDKYAAIELINNMSHRNSKYLLDKINSFNEVTELISKYEIVITQRYHGIILAHLAKTSVISIYHHDKLKMNNINIPFYGLSKNQLLDIFSEINKSKNINSLSININTFEALKQRIEDALFRN